MRVERSKKKAGWPSSWNVGIDLVTSAFPDMTKEQIETKAKTLLSKSLCFLVNCVRDFNSYSSINQGKFHWVTGSGYEESMFAGVESKFGNGSVLENNSSGGL